MDCWNCGANIAEIDRKITFRAFCEACQADLHCCKNCKFYKPGQPNDCLIPGTEYYSDRQKANYCEEFAVLGTFKPSQKEDSKKRFDDLFK
jgi:hypothetical protein